MSWSPFLPPLPIYSSMNKFELMNVCAMRLILTFPLPGDSDFQGFGVFFKVYAEMKDTFVPLISSQQHFHVHLGRVQNSSLVTQPAPRRDFQTNPCY